MKPKTVGRVGGTFPQTGPFGAGHSGTFGVPEGTVILTLDGEMPVHFLMPDDRIITRNSGTARLIRVEPVTVCTHAVQVAAGSLGSTRPDITMTLPAGQLILIRDWRAMALFGQPQAVVPVGALVDDAFICDLGVIEMQLYQMVFERDQVVYAGGLELMSTPVLPQSLRPAA
jgi:hypothetical protein